MDNKQKSKITGLSAKRSVNFVSGKDPKNVITANKVKNSSVDLPTSKGGKPTMKAKSKI